MQISYEVIITGIMPLFLLLLVYDSLKAARNLTRSGLEPW